MAKSCPFCGTSHVIESAEIAGLKPNALIPFLIDEQNAIDNCKKWSRRRILAPRKFKKSFSARNVKGVYTPCFTFDSLTNSTYQGVVGQHRTRVVGSGKNRRTETYTVWFNIKGTYDEFFDDILISAGGKVEQRQIDKISPFAKNKSQVYEKKFLHGFVANHYDKNIELSWGEAKELIDKIITRKIVSKHNADVVRYININTKHSNVTYKYMLMPVYVGNYTFNSKLYNIYINGSTGKVNGKSPVSPIRVIALIIAGIALLVVTTFIIQANENDSLQNDYSVLYIDKGLQ